LDKLNNGPVLRHARARLTQEKFTLDRNNPVLHKLVTEFETDGGVICRSLATVGTLHELDRFGGVGVIRIGIRPKAKASLGGSDAHTCYGTNVPND
jgi:hypothetical protein